MKLELIRVHHNKNETVGFLMLDGEYLGVILEDQPQKGAKVYGETRIPANTYKILLRKAGRLHEKYSKKFPDVHRGMLHIQDVPEFTWIYIHVGINDEHTLGCPLIGGALRAQGRDLKIEQGTSTRAYLRMYKRVVDSAEKGELYIRIVDSDKQFEEL